jgi:hypothetical protein
MNDGKLNGFSQPKMVVDGISAMQRCRNRGSRWRDLPDLRMRIGGVRRDHRHGDLRLLPLDLREPCGCVRYAAALSRANKTLVK